MSGWIIAFNLVLLALIVVAWWFMWKHWVPLYEQRRREKLGLPPEEGR